MIQVKRNSHGRRAAGTAALAALLMVSACSNAPRRSATAEGPAYKIGSVGARMSAAAANDPGELTRWQNRMAADMRAGRPAQRPANAQPALARSASAEAATARAAGTPASTAVSTGAFGLSSAQRSASATAFPSPLGTPPTGAAGMGASGVGSASALLEQATITPASARSLLTERTVAGAPTWAWLAAIAAGFVAALALAWVLRPRRSSPAEAARYIAPTPANDREPPRRGGARRSAPPPPRVTILAGSGGR